jgi:RimJ/RimL family protein N-acetyltransferase
MTDAASATGPAPGGAVFDIPAVATPRVVLRGFRDADLEAYAAMCADAEVMRYIGAGGPVEAGVAWRQMAIFNGSWSLRGLGMWALEERASGVLIGRVGYLCPPDWPGVELGWLLARAHWGRGYALEATAAARAFGRAQLGVTDLISLIRPDNLRSIALAERLGARPDGSVDLMGQAALRYRHPGG